MARVLQDIVDAFLYKVGAPHDVVLVSRTP